MTNSASTTQEEQPHDNTIMNNDHDESLRRLVQKRNTTPIEDGRTKKDTSKMIKKKIRTTKTEEGRHKIAYLSTFRGLKNTTSKKTRRKKVLTTHMQDRAGNEKHLRRLLRGALDVNDEDARTRTRGQVRTAPRHNEAVLDARHQRRRQPS